MKPLLPNGALSPKHTQKYAYVRNTSRPRSTSTSASSQPRPRLKFDSYEPLTFRESLEIESRREVRKKHERDDALKHASSNIPTFREMLQRENKWPLGRMPATIFQINIGKLCNLSCFHCHVESGPTRTRENMNSQTVDRCIDLIRTSPSITTVDITGGAPELNPHFRRLVTAARSMGKTVIDRCNLVVLFESHQEDLARFLAEQQVHVIASLPCYTEDNTDKQRGRKVFTDSIAALNILNQTGYGQKDSGLLLDLVYNPVGPSLPGPQATLNADYHRELYREHGILFNSLLTITNMPIRRFADSLIQNGQYVGYMELLANSFNASTVDQLMCRNTVNVAWDGKIFDCDFNAAIGLSTQDSDGKAISIWDIESLDKLTDSLISTGKHCLGCTAGAGSSCGGALE